MSWIIFLLITLALSFAFSGLESAVLSVSRVRLRHAAGEGDRRALRLLPLIEDRDALLGAITVANHVTNLAAFVIIAWKLVRVSDGRGYLIAFIVALPIFLIGLEILPKKLFRRYPFRTIRALYPIVRIVGFFRPLFRILARSAAADGSAVPDQSSGRDDLHEQAQTLENQKQLSSGAAQLIRHILNYRRLHAADVLRPLAHSIALAPEVPLSSALIFAREHGLSVLPVIGEKGSFVGVIDLATISPETPPDRLVRQYMRTLDSVQKHESALLSLQKMRKRGRSICLVLNNQSQACGLLYEEDLLNQLMGSPRL